MGAVTVPKVLLSREQIERIIPQRDPFLFVDRIIAYIEGEKAVGVFTIPGEICTAYNQGNPTFPQSLMLECANQVGAFILLGIDGYRGKIPYFGGLDGVKFRRVYPGPGDTIRIVVEKDRLRSNCGKCKFTIWLRRCKVVDGTVTFLILDPEEIARLSSGSEVAQAA
ncbi:MAG: 3-hydroxyacyl-[acyl-carrier-protein] dehydratase FabZ [Candidatus Berkelbacteria bacterium]|nr:3-hydroxyacyl-[acyl-carrier-protein] dehydratase FabZ [Candidatus Berkelbacteria bacterium]